MLSTNAIPVVRATVPALRAAGVEVTGEFYRSMFAAHPELLDVFNQANQATGEQRQALAASVVAFAEHLLGDSPAPFAPVLARIAHKHASLGVRPEQFTVVGRHLLAAVGTVLGDAVTAEVAAAWEEVYWLFATLLVAEEARLAQQAGTDPHHPYRPWRVTGRAPAAADVCSFTLLPADGSEIPAFLPGQYVSVAVELPDGRRQPRQYTLSTAPGQGELRITVRRVRNGGSAPAGAVSTFLHDQVHEGDLLQLSKPYGDVTLDPSSDPLLLISAGVGITPMLAMLHAVAATSPKRPVVAVHADRSPATHAHRDDVVTLGASIQDFTGLTWYGQATVTSTIDAALGVRAGHVDVEQIPLSTSARAYLCGPLPFMRDVRAGLLRRGLPADRIRYEVFGPDLWAAAPHPHRRSHRDNAMTTP